MSLMTFLQWNWGPVHWPEAFSVKRQNPYERENNNMYENVRNVWLTVFYYDLYLTNVQSHKSFIMWFLYQTFWRSSITGNVNSHRKQCYFFCLNIKGIVHPPPKKENLPKCTHPQFIQDVDEFVYSSEQIWRNWASHPLLVYGSSAVNGCRQNESLFQIKFISNLFTSQFVNWGTGVRITMYLSAVWTLIMTAPTDL